MPPKYTYQKAENQTIGASFALSLSLSVPTHSHTGAGHMQFYSFLGVDFRVLSICHKHDGVAPFPVPALLASNERQGCDRESQGEGHVRGHWPLPHQQGPHHAAQVRKPGLYTKCCVSCVLVLL